MPVSAPRLIERPGQAEVRRHRRLEPGDLADPVTGDADHFDARDVQDTGARVTAVLPPAGCPLARTGTIRAIPRRCVLSAVKKRCTASVPRYSNGRGGIRTHTSSVIRAISASTSSSVKAARNRSSSTRSSGRRWQWRRSRRAGRVHRRASPLQGAGDRVLSEPEQLGGLPRAESEHIAQQQHGALVRGEQLDGGDERQRDRLAGLVTGLGPGRLIREPLQQHVRIGLQPQHLASRVGSGVGTGSGAAVTGRCLEDRSWLRHRLVAMRYSQVRTDERPSNPSRPSHAASSVSWSASSASCSDPSMR